MGWFSSNNNQGKKYEVAEVQVICPHCENENFNLCNTQLNTAGLTFLGLDLANKTATTLICTECGNVQWFLKEAVEI